MAITTYSELKVAVARWLGGSDSATVTTEGIPSTIDDLITIAESRIFREARTRDTEAALSSAIDSNVLAVPNDFIALKFAYVDGTPTTMLEPRPLGWLYEQYSTRSSSGTPKFISREVNNFIFGPSPDSTYTIKGVYYKRLLPVATIAHPLFTNNPDLYLFGSLAEATILIGRDDRIALWETKFKAILDSVNLHAQQDFRGAMQMRV